MIANILAIILLLKLSFKTHLIAPNLELDLMRLNFSSYFWYYFTVGGRCSSCLGISFIPKSSS